MGEKRDREGNKEGKRGLGYRPDNEKSEKVRIRPVIGCQRIAEVGNP